MGKFKKNKKKGISYLTSHRHFTTDTLTTYLVTRKTNTSGVTRYIEPSITTWGGERKITTPHRTSKTNSPQPSSKVNPTQNTNPLKDGICWIALLPGLLGMAIMLYGSVGLVKYNSVQIPAALSPYIHEPTMQDYLEHQTLSSPVWVTEYLPAGGTITYHTDKSFIKRGKGYITFKEVPSMRNVEVGGVYTLEGWDH